MFLDQLSDDIDYALENEFQSTRVLLPYTGGRDSLSILLNLFENCPENNEKPLEIDLLYMLVGQGPEKTSMEIAAIEKQMNLVREQGLLNKKKIQLKLSAPKTLPTSISGMSEHGLLLDCDYRKVLAFHQLPFIIKNVMEACFKNRYDYVMFGWHLGDHVLLVYRQVLENLTGLLKTCLIDGPPAFRLPLLQKTKDQIIRDLRYHSGAEESAWFCEMPHGEPNEFTTAREGFSLLECGQCPACSTSKAAIARNTNGGPPYPRFKVTADLLQTLTDMPRQITSPDFVVDDSEENMMISENAEESE